MRHRASLAIFTLGCACAAACSVDSDHDRPDDGGPAIGPDATVAPDSGPPGPIEMDAGPYRSLGLNDVTVLSPLPTAANSPTLLRAAEPDGDGRAILPRELFDRVLGTNGPEPLVAPTTYDITQLVAVRFDLCHRNAPGPCTPEHEGRVRLVFQPIDQGSLGAQDVGLHAFYTVPAGENAAAVAGLRALASIANTPATAPLGVSPAFQTPAAATYTSALVAWVKQFARSERIVQLTVNAQPQLFAQVRWFFAGIEKKDGAFVEIPIVGAAGTRTREGVIFFANASYEIDPVETAPAGLTAALWRQTFDASDAATRTASLALLAAIDDPTKHGTDTVSCVGCHATTVVTHDRAAAMNIAPEAIPGRFASARDLSVAGGKSPTIDRTLRALGWFNKDPLISQRVVNETALVLDEIEQRYPR